MKIWKKNTAKNWSKRISYDKWLFSLIDFGFIQFSLWINYIRWSRHLNSCYWFAFGWEKELFCVNLLKNFLFHLFIFFCCKVCCKTIKKPSRIIELFICFHKMNIDVYFYIWLNFENAKKILSSVRFFKIIKLFFFF